MWGKNTSGLKNVSTSVNVGKINHDQINTSDAAIQRTFGEGRRGNSDDSPRRAPKSKKEIFTPIAPNHSKIRIHSSRSRAPPISIRRAADNGPNASTPRSSGPNIATSTALPAAAKNTFNP